MYEQLSSKQTSSKSMTNVTGIPDSIKGKAELKSGISLDNVRVYKNSSLPAEVGALAYTKGTDIYIGRGNDRYLGHELGHVVQQMQGRVQANKHINGMPLNDDPELENEADHFLD